jgi:hypothetical protein
MAGWTCVFPDEGDLEKEDPKGKPGPSEGLKGTCGLRKSKLDLKKRGRKKYSPWKFPFRESRSS